MEMIMATKKTPKKPTEKRRTHSDAMTLPKTPSGVQGLDEILNGGLPLGRSTLVAGGPGTGKSIVGLQFLAEGARRGEPGIFVTFEERAGAVRRNAMTLGIDLLEMERKDKLFVLEARPDVSAIVSGDFDLSGLLAILGGKATRMGAKRIVIDAVDILLTLYDNPTRERKELHLLHEWLLDREFTSVITMKTEVSAASRHAFLEFMMDCVIQMDQRSLEQIATRRIRVIKYRGSGFNGNEHPFVIKNGIRIIPLSSVELRHLPMKERVTSGSREFDRLLGGGYQRGACVLLAGPSGTGKTTFASTFARGAAKRREKTLYVSFEESAESLAENMLSPGIDLKPGLKSGHIRFFCTMPESASAEMHLARIYDLMDAFGPDHVVVDAISACLRMGTVQTANEFITRMFNTCKERGNTLLLLNQTTGIGKIDDLTSMGVSSLTDALILLSHRVEGEGMRRHVRILKERGSNHDVRENLFHITDNGIAIAKAADERAGGGRK